VSAGKFEQDYGRITVSMEVIKPQMIENRNTVNIDDVLQQTPGVSIVDGEPQIRSGSGYSFGAGSRVMVLLDDLPILSGDAGRPSWGFLPIENIQQIEVIKGASSVLYGSAALSGVINMRTAYPTDEPLTKITTFVGGYSAPQTREAKYWEGTPMRNGFQFLHARKTSKREINEMDRAIDLKDAIVQGGSVTFIKSGQALALRPDIVKSAAYVSQLQKLQDEVGVFDNNIAMKIIKDELGQDANDIYEFTPLEPIASASIGQVYKARLRTNNASVAVKVQRPDALKMAALDMYILRKLAHYIKKQKKLRSNLVGIVDEFGAQLYNELNYRQEAKNCQRFKDLYGDIPGVYVPAVYKDLTSQRVLTMEFVEGVKGPWTTGGQKMLTIGLQCSVLQLLGSGGFMHSVSITIKLSRLLDI
jgi:hypothetical protein